MNRLYEVSDQDCLQMGRSVLLLSLKGAISILQAQADTLETQLKGSAPQNGHAEIRPAMQRTMAMLEQSDEASETQEAVSRPRKKKSSGPAISAYWAQMTPEQRSREMKRRRRVGERRKKAAGLL